MIRKKKIWSHFLYCFATPRVWSKRHFGCTKTVVSWQIPGKYTAKMALSALSFSILQMFEMRRRSLSEKLPHTVGHKVLHHQYRQQGTFLFQKNQGRTSSCQIYKNTRTRNTVDLCALELLWSSKSDFLWQSIGTDLWHGLPDKRSLRGRMQPVWVRRRTHQHWRTSAIRHRGTNQCALNFSTSNSQQI